MASEGSLLEKAGPDAGATCRIVVVSASPVNRIILTHSIERMSHKVTCMAGWEALSELDIQRLALAVLDLTETSMPVDQLLAPLLDLRGRRNDGFPRILGVVRDTPFDGTVKAAMSMDAMVSLPLTQDKVQAAVLQLLRRGLLH